MMLFNTMYFGMGFLRMSTTGLVARSPGEDAVAQITSIMVRGLILAFVFVLELGMAVSRVAIASVVAQRSGFLFIIFYINR